MDYKWFNLGLTNNVMLAFVKPDTIQVRLGTSKNYIILKPKVWFNFIQQCHHAIQSTIVGETLVFVEKDASITLQNFVRYENCQTFMLPICNLKREEVDRMLMMEHAIEESIDRSPSHSPRRSPSPNNRRRIAPPHSPRRSSSPHNPRRSPSPNNLRRIAPPNSRRTRNNRPRRSTSPNIVSPMRLRRRAPTANNKYF
ncbi:hypothetical protein TNIN_179351 [Trichonephila inaurata madagascariensis]|uniref:Uncharacterized protein n=1 Tax=Trichonephila inaurata madagascariensis TaxID=2747483 RepID=A0A8X7CHF7_9ARAC|nr:hypothetical protein TNIN_179351 [Trichonephila inaurata madagascariensis]